MFENHLLVIPATIVSLFSPLYGSLLPFDYDLLLFFCFEFLSWFLFCLALPFALIAFLFLKKNKTLVLIIAVFAAYIFIASGASFLLVSLIDYYNETSGRECNVASDCINGHYSKNKIDIASGCSRPCTLCYYYELEQQALPHAFFSSIPQCRNKRCEIVSFMSFAFPQECNSLSASNEVKAHCYYWQAVSKHDEKICDFIGQEFCLVRECCLQDWNWNKKGYYSGTCFNKIKAEEFAKTLGEKCPS
ncbi:MAG: hypothetical protein QXK06_05935 [Candidatus Diapherotrites archaeon]